MKKNKKAFKKIKLDNIIIGVIILIIIIGGGIYYLLNKKTDLPNFIKKPDPVPVKKVQIVDMESKTRPYAVSINNIGIARPFQSGLQEAYIIYE